MRRPRRTTHSIPRAATFSLRPARRRTRSATTASRRCPKAPMRRSRKFCCRLPACRRISAASGAIHVRNDHANVQFRINGVMLPDGVTGFGSILDPSLIGSMSLITGALPAEFGMRTVGLVDITTRNDIFNNSGSVSLYGGSRGTFQPSFEYGGTFGNTCPSAAPAPTNSSAAPVATKPQRLPPTDCFPGVQYLFTGRYCNPRRASKTRSPASTPFTTFPSRPRVSPTCRLSSTRCALELDCRHVHQLVQIPNVPASPSA